MKKTILITGATDGIGYETAQMLVELGHEVLVHGRNPQKLSKVKEKLGVTTYTADLMVLDQVNELSQKIKQNHKKIDVIINNAGVFKTSERTTKDGLDARYVVNTLAPYLLTCKLLEVMPDDGRVVGLSSAAQAPVDIECFFGKECVDDSTAYAQSKLALTMWTNHMATKQKQMIVSVNPASLLGSKMVKEAYGINGGDIRIGADILVRAALSDEFAQASGKYYDNDVKAFANPHPDALAASKNEAVVTAIEKVLEKWL